MLKISKKYALKSVKVIHGDFILINNVFKILLIVVLYGLMIQLINVFLNAHK